jgi:hypothetical protein
MPRDISPGLSETAQVGGGEYVWELALEFDGGQD